MSGIRQASKGGSGTYRVFLSTENPSQNRTVYVTARDYSSAAEDRTRANRDVNENLSAITRQRTGENASTKQSEENSEQIKHLKEEIAALKATVTDFKAHRDAYMQKLEKAGQREDNLQVKINYLTKQRDECLRSKETLHVAKKKLEAELSQSKDRLSRMMGIKLSDNNPEIADLSDKNRPTKLAEKYLELYDNQWTDAFEIVAETSDERQGIATLLGLLWDILDFCATKAETQIAELTKAVIMTGPEGRRLSQGFMKQLKDFRKANAEAATEALFELYSADMQVRNERTFRIIQHAKVQPFIKECMELCWMMAIQDPPVVLGSGKRTNALEKFDSSVYKPYTMTGAYFDYLVWPPLYLHQNGPLLAKGVAQGKKSSKEITPNITRKLSANVRAGPGSAVPVTDPKASQAMARSYRSTKPADFSRTVIGSSGLYDNFRL